MPVLINFKVCDNASECDGIRNCPVNAFKWNEEKQTIYIDNELCIDCGKCAESCSVGAIRFAKDENEYDEIKKEIEDDTRTINDLFVDRFGAAPIQSDYLYQEKDFENISSNSARPIVIELFNDDSISCLLKSIPIKEILEAFDKESIFKKVQLESNEILEKYKIQELPALLFFEDGKLLDKIEGYYEDENSKELFEQIKSIK